MASDIGAVRRAGGGAGALRAGIARRDITPRIGSPAGLGLTEPVTSVWDPLTATVLVLDRPGARFALVGVDLTGVLAATHQAIREAVADATGVPADHVVVNASHTHSAPYVSADLQALLRPHGLRLTDDDYPDQLARSVALAAADAATALVPVTAVAAGRAPVERVAANRRPMGPDGRVVHRYGRPPAWMRELPEGLIDPDAAVLQFDGPDGAAIATILNYACHPTAAGGDNHAHVSADFVGVGRSIVEADTGSMCLFLQGCAGNTGTGGWVTDDARADTAGMGRRLADGALRALSEAIPISLGTGEDLRGGVARIALELDPFPTLDSMDTAFVAAVRAGDAGALVAIGDALVLARRVDALRVARITAIVVGCIALVVLPGEVFLQHGLAIRAGSPYPTTIVAAYDDNTLQYLPTAADFPHGEYEVEGGWRYIRPGQGERLAAAAVELLEGLARGSA